MIKYFADMKVKEYELVLKKWPILKEIKYLLGIPYRATIALQSRELTLSDLFGIWTKMLLHLESCCAQKPYFKTNLPQQLFKTTNERKEKLYSNPFMVCALFLDPRYRRQILTNENKFEEAKQTLRNLWYRIQDSPTISDNGAQMNTSGDSSNSSIDLKFDEQAALENFLSNGRDSTPMSDDIEFIIDSFDPEAMPFNDSILTYWEKAKRDHPHLYRLATIVFSIPPTEVQIERDFSKLDYVFNDRRCSLMKERLEDIMLLNLNPELFFAVKHDEIEELERSLSGKN